MLSFLFSYLISVLTRPKRATIKLLRVEDFDEEPCFVVIINDENRSNFGRKLFLMNLEPGDDIWLANIEESDLIDQ